MLKFIIAKDKFSQTHKYDDDYYHTFYYRIFKLINSHIIVLSE